MKMGLTFLEARLKYWRKLNSLSISRSARACLSSTWCPFSVLCIYIVQYIYYISIYGTEFYHPFHQRFAMCISRFNPLFYFVSIAIYNYTKVHDVSNLSVEFGTQYRLQANAIFIPPTTTFEQFPLYMYIYINYNSSLISLKSLTNFYFFLSLLIFRLDVLSFYLSYTSPIYVLTLLILLLLKL